MYEYNCTLVRVIDGDTVDVDIDLGFDTILKNQRIRLAGIDTPESRTSDSVEKIYGLAAKKFLVEHLALNNPNNKLILRTTMYDAKGKFGRILGEIYNLFGAEPMTADRPTISANKYLVENHLAVVYHGQSKEDIKEGHLRNRLHLEEDTSKNGS